MCVIELAMNTPTAAAMMGSHRAIIRYLLRPFPTPNSQLPSAANRRIRWELGVGGWELSPAESEPHARAYREPYVVTEERLLRGAAVVERRPGIFQQAIADVHADDRAFGREHVDASAGIEREHRASGREHARQRRRKDQDAHDGLAAEREEAGPQLRERPYAGQSRANGHAQQPLEPARAV